jgi:hypothetical protein
LSPNNDIKLFLIANIHASPNLVVEKNKINLDSNEFGSLYFVERTCHPRNEKQKSIKTIAIKEFMLVINLELFKCKRKFLFLYDTKLRKDDNYTKICYWNHIFSKEILFQYDRNTI